MGVSDLFYFVSHQGAVNTYLVDILVSTRSTEAVKTELLVGIPLPAHGGHDLDGQRWDAVWQNAESVLLRLGIEDLEAGDGDHTRGEVVLLLKSLDGVDGNADFRTGGHNGDIRLLGLVHDVTTLDGGRNGGVLELREVLAGQSQDGWGV